VKEPEIEFRNAVTCLTTLGLLDWQVGIKKPRAAKIAIPAKEEAIELSELKPIR
jgi:hypothetical protein